MSVNYEVSINIPDSATSQVVSISGANAQTTAISISGYQSQLVLVQPTVDCFARIGTNPIATAAGADLFLRGGQTYRTTVPTGYKIGFITSGGVGSVYITPNA